MSAITQIATLINLELKGGTLAGKRFQKGEFLGLAELMEKTGEGDSKLTYPAIIDNEGEGTEVQLNDSLPFQCYHRIITIAPSVESSDDYGDGDTKIETTTVKMVVFANRRIMKFQVDDLITAINVGFKRSLSKTELSAIGNYLSQVDITVTSIELDKKTVWQDEFGYEQPLPNFYQCFAVNYSVQSHIMAGCYALC